MFKKMYWIMVCDDCVLQRTLLASMLESMNLNTALVKNGYDALTLIDSQKFDVILMDYEMPGINGIETIKRMIEAGCESRFVMVSGSPLKKSEEDYLEKTGIEMARKPVNMEWLQQICCFGN